MRQEPADAVGYSVRSGTQGVYKRCHFYFVIKVVEKLMGNVDLVSKGFVI
jgi:hypothetical protein